MALPSWVGPALLVLALGSCAPSTFDARLREGDAEAALVAFHASEDVRRRPDAMLQAAVLLDERAGRGDAEAAAALLAELVERHPESPEARVARVIQVLRGENESLAAARDSLLERLRRSERQETSLAGRVQELEEELALRESLLSVLTRLSGRLEAQLEDERRELRELRRTLEQLMEVDLDRPTIPPQAPLPDTSPGGAPGEAPGLRSSRG